MGCILPVLAAALLMAIGLHWLAGTLLGVFMHPLLTVVEVGVAIAAVVFLVRLAPDAADWVKAKIAKK